MRGFSIFSSCCVLESSNTLDNLLIFEPRVIVPVLLLILLGGFNKDVDDGEFDEKVVKVEEKVVEEEAEEEIDKDSLSILFEVVESLIGFGFGGGGFGFGFGMFFEATL